MLLQSIRNTVTPMSNRQERQRFIRYYREQTGEHEIEMQKVAALAKKMGWKMPSPPSDVELLARQFADDAQAEKKYDDETGRPYRVYQAIPINRGGQLSLFVYVDIDEASRNQMWKSAVHRREQMVSDGYKLTLDVEHWNSINSGRDPITLPMDFTLDINIRKASDQQGDEDAA
jgi:hypothetical protein